MTARIPTVADLAADPITHHYEDMIAPSGLTNFLGTVQVTHDLTALAAVTFPPISQGLARTGALFVDGRLFESYGAPVTHAWRPDRVVRSATVAGLAIATATVCVPGEQAVAIDIEVTNATDTAREVTLTLAVNARVVHADGAWMSAESPNERNDAVAGPAETGGTADRPWLEFHSAAGDAWSVQGLDAPGTATVGAVPPSAVEGFEVGIGGAGRGGELGLVLRLAAGETGRVGYVHAVAGSSADAHAAFERVAANVPAAVASAEEFWNHQLEAAFTPGNEEWSGSMPMLEFETPALERLYWWGVLGVIWFRREWPGNVLGRSYDTLMPNYWATTTFIWDYSLSSRVHAMLDPVEMRRQLEHWIARDIHTMFGTSSLTGGPVGQWYSVNDYAMVRLVNDYVRITGDVGFLSHPIAAGDAEPRPAWQHLVAWATAWKELRRGSDLADYGEINNLLECVSTYTHEVASLNAANVWTMRTVAALLDEIGETDAAAGLRREASDLVPSVLSLYVPGSGFFAARQPDGTPVPVRHCYDFNIVGSLIADELPAGMRAGMVAFFRNELQTENWMHALSPWDPDASFSLRPDHQWNGAYPAWPADAGRALIALGARDVAVDWAEGLARTANQGPPGQAHFVEEAWPAVGGGARKAPPQLPYINDWACSSAGSWVEFVLATREGATDS
jgi:hypothetical protein